MPVPTSALRAVDADALVDGARAALIANTTIATTLAVSSNPQRIANEVIEEGVTPPYITLALASVVYESPYDEAVINCLIDVSCYTQGASTTTVRALMKAALTALVDTAWTATNFAIWSVNMEEAGTGIRNTTDTASGVIMRGRQATIRIHAQRTG